MFVNVSYIIWAQWHCKGIEFANAIKHVTFILRWTF